MNTVQLIGRLTRDPESRSANDNDVCTLRLAVPRRRRSDGEDPGAVFVDVVTFAGLARSCAEHLGKGRQVAVTGRLELSEWEDTAGQRRSRHEVIADEVTFLEHPKVEVGA
ncbi:MAG: single-stranded DNA-binding protein [Acidimicrobiia bacterium]